MKKQRDPKLAERFEKRLSDELFKIFDDSESFYYSRTLDLTNSLQRQYEIEKILESEAGTGKPVVDITKWWKHVDDRFFWNKHMLKDIIALGVSKHSLRDNSKARQGFPSMALLSLFLWFFA